MDKGKMPNFLSAASSSPPRILENTFCRVVGKVTSDLAGLDKYSFLSISYANMKS